MIECQGLSARHGTFRLAEVTFTVPTGQYGVVIGPAGSGKTTLLETIAGVVPATAGTLRLNGRDCTATEPEARGLSLVYQHAFLFPHLSVAHNIAYGAASSEQAEAVARRFGADALTGRPVRALSGGERQLVALARAFARRPAVVLLDEPFSALDPRRRTIVRREVRNLHREWGLTTLHVTHDFTEAGLLGDVAVLLDEGRALQWGAPEEVFRRPASPYIAEFLGAENVLAGTVRVLAEEAPDWLEGEPAPIAHGYRAIEFTTGALVLYTVGDYPLGTGYAVIRAEEIVLSLEPPAGSARNRFRGVVAELATLGALTRVTVDVAGVPLVASLTTRSAKELALKVGTDVTASFKAMAVHLC
ncbi:MAG: ABC transporter ATP-binding protein [Gemmatimonadetes bacterium]|nr:ABC transporter ATP-binding protein [Gemmatimonadota bacterium]